MKAKFFISFLIFFSAFLFFQTAHATILISTPAGSTTYTAVPFSAPGLMLCHNNDDNQLSACFSNFGAPGWGVSLVSGTTYHARTTIPTGVLCSSLEFRVLFHGSDINSSGAGGVESGGFCTWTFTGTASSPIDNVLVENNFDSTTFSLTGASSFGTSATYINASGIGKISNGVPEFVLQTDDFTPPPPVTGIDTQTTPASGAIVPFNVFFTGTYTNASAVTQICVQLTTTDASVAPHCSNIPLVDGTDLPYAFNYTLSPNHSYTYTLTLTDGTTTTTPTAPITFSTGALPDRSTLTPARVPEACDWTNPATFQGCISNIFQALFYPSSESLDIFGQLQDTFKNKPPFGYVTSIIEVLKNLNDTGASVFTLSSLPILNTMIFDPIRTALIWVLWVAFAFVFYHRLKNLKI